MQWLGFGEEIGEHVLDSTNLKAQALHAWVFSPLPSLPSPLFSPLPSLPSPLFSPTHFFFIARIAMFANSREARVR